MTQGNEFKVIETQEQLNSIIEPRLERERKKYTDTINGLENDKKDLEDQLAKLTDASNQKEAKIEELNSQISDKDNKLEDFRVNQMRNDLAYEYGLPRDFSKRLQGSTYEEIEADAKEMAKTFDDLRPDPPIKNNEPNVYKGLDASYASMAENLFKGEY
ncbi:hypothetical protein [Anaerococcus nagyae]|uniref:hypothetical protein n=1 Tax=Anaerococcus nagyae TaxID=1755241 RepID=UPI003736BDB0